MIEVLCLLDYLADICVQKIYFRSLCKKKVNEAIADSISAAGKKKFFILKLLILPAALCYLCFNCS